MLCCLFSVSCDYGVVKLTYIIDNARNLTQAHNWTEIDVTGRAAEETATVIGWSSSMKGLKRKFHQTRCDSTKYEMLLLLLTLRYKITSIFLLFSTFIHHFKCFLQSAHQILDLFCLCTGNNHQEYDDNCINVRQKFRALATVVGMWCTSEISNHSQNISSKRNHKRKRISVE